VEKFFSKVFGMGSCTTGPVRKCATV